jgi:hypothetical protein
LPEAQQGKHRKLFQSTADALQVLLTADHGACWCDVPDLRSDVMRTVIEA